MSLDLAGLAELARARSCTASWWTCAWPAAGAGWSEGHAPS
jgi:hypothetical protein